MKFRLVEENELQKRERRHRKKQKGLSPFCYLNPNAGNVEYNVKMFNKMNGNDTDSSCVNCSNGSSSGEATSMGEALDKNDKRYTFKYEGPVYRFERLYERKCEPIYTTAKTFAQAINQIKARLKELNGLAYSARLDIEEGQVEQLEEIDYSEYEQRPNKKVEIPNGVDVWDVNGKDVYYYDGYFYIVGLNQPFISEEDIYDYLGD